MSHAGRTHFSRRDFLQGGLLAGAAALTPGRRAPLFEGSPVLTSDDDALLEDLQRRSFQYFLDHADSRTGQVRDRARADGSEHVPGQRDVASIAATGFGLAALCIAADRGWMSRRDVRERVQRTIGFLAREMPHERGWFYHFVNARTGAREWQCELSSIDTALLTAGVLTARQCFADDPAIVTDATAVYERIDFPWMLNGDRYLLSMGWKPETGFLDARWRQYCELMILYLLGMGSSSHPLPAESWWAWTRPVMRFQQFEYISAADPLFVHQFSHAWVDFRRRRERRAAAIDWWQNSIVATRAHKAFCLSLSDEFPGYRENVWGITASDSAKGYVAWGGPPRNPAIDGTVVPCAPGGSLMVAPAITVPVMRTLKESFGARIYGRYGFVDAFNPNSGWVNPDCIGIDVGITLVSAENLRSGRVWEWFMANREIARVRDAVLEAY